MNMELLKSIIALASLILSCFVLLYTFIRGLVNAIKKKKAKADVEEENDFLREKVEDEQATFKLVNEIIPLAIKKAEETPLIDGPTKKLLAMSEILLTCNEDGIDFEMYKDFISEQIEALITFSKTINKRKE